jgi:hypothetical protein
MLGSILMADCAQNNPKNATSNSDDVATSRVVLPYKDPDGYAVLSAWIRTYVRGGSEPLVIEQEAGASSLKERVPSYSREPANHVPPSCFPKRIRSEFQEAFSDYGEQNSYDWLFERSIGSKRVGYALVPASGLLPGWGAGGENPPGDTRIPRYIVFSAVGFDSHHTRAVLFVAGRYRLGGAYSYYLFRKDGASWRAVQPPCLGLIVE